MEYTNIFESSIPQHGERATERIYRKIELQSSDDLTFLLANVSRAAREKIDRHLPPDAAVVNDGDAAQVKNGQDAMRTRVEGLVDDYIRATFNAAKDNLCINGMSSEEMEAELAKAQEGQEIEPFDAKLARRIQSLSKEIEDHTLKLAKLRRQAPAATAAKFHESFTRAMTEDDARLRSQQEETLQVAKNTKVDINEIKRLDEVQRTWQMGTGDLGHLKSGLGATVARMEKARAAADVLTERA